MLLKCDSCQKKFVVPDSAISKSGRLVQCGSCGNKWTQYPIINNELKKKITNKKTSVLKNKNKKNLYTVEYLKQKHGLDIENSNNLENNKLQQNIEKNSGFGFYGSIFILFIFLITLFAILRLTKEAIIQKYPASEIYITYLYEIINIIRVSLTGLMS